MAYITRTGKVLLNPQEKVRKYITEVKTKKAFTNDGRPKIGQDGNQIKLTAKQLNYRYGYITANSDSQKAWKSKNKNYKRKTTAKACK